MSGSKSDVQLSKQLSWLLRHGALEMGLPVQPDGFVSVAAIQQHPRYAAYTLEVLQRLEAADKKCRYTLRHTPNSGDYDIRANQGHSLAAVQAEKCFERIKIASEVPLAVHGTYYKHWESIRRNGLRCMQRNHVHFTTSDRAVQPQRSSDGSLCAGSAISGFRQDCQILIYLDVRKAIEQGELVLYRSSNNVILCSGQEQRCCIPSEYFARVVDRRTGVELTF